MLKGFSEDESLPSGRIRCSHVPTHEVDAETSESSGPLPKGIKRKRGRPCQHFGFTGLCGKCGLKIKRCEACHKWVGTNQHSRHVAQFCPQNRAKIER